MVAGQRVALGRAHAHQTVTVLVAETTLAVELDDADGRVFCSTALEAAGPPDAPARGCALSAITGQEPRGGDRTCR